MMDGYNLHAIESESLRETQDHIEHWTADNISPSCLDQEPLVEEVFICYGTVRTDLVRVMELRFLQCNMSQGSH
jgi:hypothetical protein